VYAAATGLASGLPAAYGLAAGLARGAAMRRVARRRGVRLTREAREELARVGSVVQFGGRGVEIARTVVRRVLAPVRVASRFEDALTTLLAAWLLEHYLLTADRRPGAPVTGAEARRVRMAMDDAVDQIARQTVRDAPAALWRALYSAVTSATGLDEEDRDPAERLVDTLLDAFADSQGEVVEELIDRFDRALQAPPRDRDE
jgi:hypothetical protein